MTELDPLNPELANYINKQFQRYGGHFYIKWHQSSSGLQITVMTEKIAGDIRKLLDNPMEAIQVISLEKDTGIELKVLQGPVPLFTSPVKEPLYLADELLTGERIRALEPLTPGGWIPVTVRHNFENTAPKELGWLIFNSRSLGRIDESAKPPQLLGLNEAVEKYLQGKNIRYRLGGKTPKTGFDCSGLVQTIVRDIYGIWLPRLARWQNLVGKPATQDTLQLGSLACFEEPNGKISHVGLVVQPQGLKPPVIVHSSLRVNGIRLEDLSQSPWVERDFAKIHYRNFYH